MITIWQKITDLGDLQCTIHNYLNHIISALGDNLLFHGQVCECEACNQNYVAQCLKAKELSCVKKV